MKFIELRKGIRVRKEEIICVETINASSCKVYTETMEYKSDRSAEMILAMLEQDTGENRVNQYFAG